MIELYVKMFKKHMIKNINDVPVLYREKVQEVLIKENIEFYEE